MRRIFLLTFVCIFASMLYSSRVLQLEEEGNESFLWYRFATDTSVSFTDILPSHDDYVMITVYRSDEAEPQHLWRVAYNDSSYVGKTTHSFYTHRFESFYDIPRLFSSPRIELTRQSLPLSTTDTSFSISFGSYDTLPSPTFLEIAYFPYSLPYKEALSFQTYLALKYGITLDKANYITSGRMEIWSNVNDLDYYNRVVGIGSDTIYDFRSTESVQSDGAATLILYKEDIAQGEYYLLGDDDSPLSFTHRDTLPSVLYRTWKVKSFVSDSMLPSVVSVKIRPQVVNCSEESFALLHYSEDISSNSYQILQPDSIDIEGYFYFTDIDIDADSSGSDYFGIQGFPFTQMTRSGVGSNDIGEEDEFEFDNSSMRVDVTPNPSTGYYQISVVLSEVHDVQIKIYDSRGIVIDEQQLRGSREYVHSGMLYTPQLYIIEVTAGEEVRQIKYIVK